MLAHLVLALVYAVAPDATSSSSITLTVESTSSEGTWSCLVDLGITAKVTRDATRKDVDQVTVTVHAPHARMEAAASSPASFKTAIASESPSQQTAIALLDGQSVSFAVNRATGAMVSPGARPPRFAADVSFAGVDAAYWFALVWVAGADGNARAAITRTHSTAWGVPWKLAGEVSFTPASYLAVAGTLEGDLTVGRGANAIKRHLKVTIAPQRP